MAKAWRAVTAWGSFCQTVRWRHLCSASRTQTWECCGRRKGGPSPSQPLVCRPVSARPPSDPPDITLLVCSPGSVRLDSTPLSSFPVVSEAVLGESSGPHPGVSSPSHGSQMLKLSSRGLPVLHRPTRQDGCSLAELGGESLCAVFAALWTLTSTRAGPPLNPRRVQENA